MLVQILDTPGFIIDESNRLTRHARWLLSAESTDGDFAVAAMLWAGSAGGDWRVPNADGSGYTADNTVRIDKVECKVLTATACEIHFTGVPRLAAAVRATGSITVERAANLEEFKSAVFNIPAALLESYLPEAGDALTWAGEDYLCESVKAVEQPDGTYAATIRAVNTSVLTDGKISTCKDAQGEVTTGVWLVEEDALSTFLTANALNCSAVSWAGSNCYVSAVRTEPANSARRTRVTLEARPSTLTMLEALRHEVIEGYNGNVAQTDVYWVSRWRASASDQSQFQSLLGTSAATWAENGYVVSKITPKRIADSELEYVIEARKPDSIYSLSIHWRDNDLPNRVEYSVQYGSMFFSALCCGYARYNLNYMPLRNWNPTYQCPLVTATPLPLNFISRAKPLLEIVQTTYLNGTSAANLDAITAMFSGSRVSTQTIGTITGSWLLCGHGVDDYTDSYGRKWTRITRVYRLAPAGYAWNPNFF